MATEISVCSQYKIKEYDHSLVAVDLHSLWNSLLYNGVNLIFFNKQLSIKRKIFLAMSKVAINENWDKINPLIFIQGRG